MADMQQAAGIARLSLCQGSILRPRIARQTQISRIAPTAPMMSWAIQPEGGMTFSALRMALRTSAPTMPRMMFEKMPILDGSSTLQALKASPKTQRIPVVMVTVENGNGYARRLFEMGVDMHVVKPFDPTEILAIIDRFVQVEAN